MRALLDTHTFLWWITDHPKLPERVRGIIRRAGNTLFVSAASGWEIAIKARLDRLHISSGDAKTFVQDQILLNRFETPPIRMDHALYVFSLPNHHRDPFDRILVAQATIERIPVLTIDPQIAQYDVEVIWS